jgi:hypothetical protein
VAIDDVVQQPVQQVADPEFREVGAFVQRSATASMSSRSSWRTVISALLVMKAAISLVVSSPVPVSSRAP